MSSPEHKQKIWGMIKDIKVGMLVTLDNDTPAHGQCTWFRMSMTAPFGSTLVGVLKSV
ncbi:hypothetical protein HSBAA_22030 [Vreelandella sulfidaeris]|uniref:Uncharacterized protein n=1 Tax=Vreelandella sulfidaeris TaxID=115553 RepID=A0A455U5U5_9GAMM|nr:hypothetical protein HSBAA_22030 [Halomonas sulfidaeris]